MTTAEFVLCLAIMLCWVVGIYFRTFFLKRALLEESVQDGHLWRCGAERLLTGTHALAFRIFGWSKESR